MRRFVYLFVLVIATAAFADEVEIPIINYAVNPDGSIAGTLQTGITVLFSTVPLAINHYDVLRIGMPGTDPMSIGTYSNSLNNLSISIPNGTFSDIVGDFYGVYSQLAGGGVTGANSPCSLAFTIEGAMCDPMLVTMNFTDGTSSVLTFNDLNTEPDGHNPFSIIAPDGKRFSSIFIGGLAADTQAKFYALSDIGLSGVEIDTPAQAPEPATLAMVGMGVGFLRWRRR